MNINSTPNYNTHAQSFKAVNIVQVPKNVFKHPEDLKECSKIFGSQLAKISGDKTSGPFGALLAFITTKPHKSMHGLEKPSYKFARSAMTKAGIENGLSWFRQNTGLPIADALDPECHSFFVYTKEDISNAWNALSKPFIKRYAECIGEGQTKYPDDRIMRIAYAVAKYGVEAEKNLSEVTSPVSQTFKIDSLDDLSTISDKLDF